MHDDQHIANALQCNCTPNRTTLEIVRHVSVKAFYFALIVGAIYAATRPTANANTIRFIAACQNLTKKRPVEPLVKDVPAQSGCVKQEMPPPILAHTG
jgi:hypothetical protein